MLTYQDLLNDIEKSKNEKLAEFLKPILNTNIAIKGIYSKDIKELIKKYKDIDINDFDLDVYYELNFLYIAIGLKKKKTLKEQIDFIFENSKHIVSWGITDSTFRYFKLKDFEEALPVIQKFINTNDEFLIRYGYLFLFNYVKDKDNLERIFSLFKNSSYFYVKMVEGWVLSSLYIYSNEETYNYLLNSSLDYEIKNIAIRKICDSYRVNKEEKDKLKLLRKRLKEKTIN